MRKRAFRGTEFSTATDRGATEPGIATDRSATETSADDTGPATIRGRQ